MSLTFSEIIANYNNSIAQLKNEAINIISTIPETKLERLSDNPSTFVVTLSTIKENNGILSPFYYDIAAQKKDLIDLVNNSKGINFIDVLADIGKTGKRTVRVGSSSYQQHYAPEVVAVLKQLQELT